MFDFLGILFGSAFFVPVFGAFIMGCFGVFMVQFLFPKIGLMDFPQRYGLLRKPLPYPAGIAMGISFLFSLLFFFPIYSHLFVAIAGFAFSFVLLLVVSFWDDRAPLPAVFRLFCQALCAVIIILSGTWIEFLTNPFAVQAFHLPFWLGAGITFFWIIGFINATNWLDGVPNLTLSSGVVASSILGFVSLTPAVMQPNFALLCFLFAAVLLPFSVINIGKTRFILGDSGSMIIGFCLAVFSLFSGGKMATVLVVMSIPIFDSVFVFFVRILRKQSPFVGKDRLHLHETLVDKGIAEWKIFLFYFLVSLVLGISVLFLGTWGKISLLLVFMVCFMLIRYRLLSHKV